MKKNNRGVIVIIAFLALGVLLLLGVYFISFTITESKIAQSQGMGVKAYYLAEAGIYKAIWKLKNDEEWSTCFIGSEAGCPDCATWSATDNIDTSSLVANSSITVSIENTSCARGELVATSTILLPNGKSATRVIKTTVFKALAGLTEDNAIFTGGASENLEINNTYLSVYGNLFSNNNLNIKGASQVEVYPHLTAKGKILSVGNYNDEGNSVISTARCGKNICDTTETCECVYIENFQECTLVQCRPHPTSVPLVDFDVGENSFKNRAILMEASGQCNNSCNGADCYYEGGFHPGNNQCVFTSTEFEELLWAAGENGTLSLGSDSDPVIVYVEGPIELRGGRHLLVNGALVADDNIGIGLRYSWVKKGVKEEGLSQITVTRPTETTASGILSKRKIDFGQHSAFSSISIEGVVYANDEISLISIPERLNVLGGMISRKLDLSSLWQWLNVTLDNDIIRYGLGYAIDGEVIDPQYSPIITVEHWEEAY